MKQEEDKFTGLPENAFRELKPGEVYNPLMAPSKSYHNVKISPFLFIFHHFTYIRKSLYYSVF